jgi:methylisocitrate lyase
MAATWLDRPRKPKDAAARLRELIARRSACAVPGAYDGMSALIARQAGFEALYLSGAALSASMALPDLGLLTLDDVAHKAREIVRASDLPLIVDCDTGFGEALNVMHTVRVMEEVGAACVQIEDQQLPKKCGHLNDKRLIPADEMCRKVAAAKTASSGILICARTDAAGSSLDDALLRARRYHEAGADVIFVEALTSQDDIKRVRAEVKAPLLANMTEFGRTPDLALSDWDAFGFELVIFPVSAFRVASGAARRFYASLRQNGHVREFLPQMMTRTELYDTIGYYDYEALDSSIARTVLPDR